MQATRRSYNGPYKNEYLNQVAFPMGGMGAGMICLEDTGAFSHVSLCHRPEVFNEPLMFAALHVKGARTARLLEGPVPMRKAFGLPGSGNGNSGSHHGLPRFAKASFTTRFPFGIVQLADKTMPVAVELTGWSPFTPGDADSSSLPVAGLEYRLRNNTNKTVEGVFSFHAKNFMRSNDQVAGTVSPMNGGFLLGVPASPMSPDIATPEKPENPTPAQCGPQAAALSGQFAAFTTSSGVKTDCAWFRGAWFDSLTMLWKNIAAGKSQTKAPFAEGKTSDGGSFYVPFKLKARAGQTIRVLLAWHVPQSGLCVGDNVPCDCKRESNEPAAYVPWYASRFKDIHAVSDYWRANYDMLRARSKLFSDCFYDTTLPPAIGADVALYEELLAKGKKAMETTLWNGEFFFQRIQWTGLRAADPTTAKSMSTNYTPEALAILEREGPKYQYGAGCLSDGVLGDWLARMCGVPPVLEPVKVRSHVRAVFKHNFKTSLADHANPQRPGYAFGQEGGLLLCTWPKSDKLSLPFPYSDEVWTGFEYQVAAHLIMTGRVREGVQVVATARKRYDGRWRNPFNEYECGHWYARAMSSYGLLQALSGARYDAVDKTLHLQPAVKGDFKAFLSTATGFGTVGVRNGKPFLKIVSGQIDVARIEYQP